jgi:hypothetical protein
MRKGGDGVRLRKILSGIISLAFILATVTGCFRIKADELYSLPQPSREYLKLQAQLATVLATSAEYSPPLAGPNRQSVQLRDVDGDGRNEAIAFFRTTGDKPLKIHILKQTGTAYETADVIDGDGAAIDSIRYADMNGDGILEFVIGWRMSPTLLHMNIYTIKGGQYTSLADGDYTEIAISDMDLDGRQDVVTIRLPSSELPAQADMFSLRSDGDIDIKSARLSKGIESISGVLKGGLEDGTSALFIEGNYSGGSLVTDIVAWRDGNLSNITAGLSSSVSEDTLRSYTVYSADINRDGVTEVPSPRQLQNSSADTTYYVIDWYKYDRYGLRTRVFSTYHDFSDGWYLILPDAWRYIVSVRREDSVAGERTLIFSSLSGTYVGMMDFLKIYTLSGDNKDDRAKLPERFTLQVHGDTIYSAEIIEGNTEITISIPQVKDGFRLLYSDWATDRVS